MMTSPNRPSIVTNTHLLYLDDLRESGVTNMFGAGPFLVREFGIDRNDAYLILEYWMQTFGDETR